ncbi:dihydropteroate synthase [Micropruina sonneratiae]|uniref:dihydropteroate synthase n=1 Tax=Micropruina sonneratiae TaxID=2986940 RepID=UPI002226D81D|nr:dihydropteroate synthase [Micropruina sp. KQZ13P-5]MCW3156616.1 dihydropteroate synthase [Micropruina sp. KQZ13P-5]
MGILNVTPDSFSDGGDFLAAEAAIAHGRRLLADGADLVDVGGESTRPGAERVPVEEELRRVLPVIRALAGDGAMVSIDTMRAEVAATAVGAGATIVNDVSGGLADPAMLDTVAALGACYVAMHWRGQSDVMHRLTDYHDVVADVAAELAGRRDAALAAGIDPGRLILDPGIGFAKTADQNWTLLAGLDGIAALGQPVLVGVSRKRFLGTLLDDRPPRQRDDASVALTTLLAQRGVWAVRTHTVRAHADAVAVVTRLRRGEASAPVE